MFKDYLYSIYDSIKVAAKNLATKMEAIRLKQDEILAIKKSGEKLVGEGKDVTKSIDKTVDNVGEYDTNKIGAIDSVDGLKDLVKDLKETKSVAGSAIEDIEKHQEKIEKFAQDAKKTADEIDQTENALSELKDLEAEVEKIRLKTEKYIKEEELEEKDEKANRMPAVSPESVVKECENKKFCALELIEIKDKAGRSLAYSLMQEVESEEDKENSEKISPPPKTLYVIVGEREGYDETIDIEAIGECKSGNACPVVTLKGGPVDEREVKNLSKIELKSEKVIPDQSWADFLRKIIVPDMDQLARPQVYKVRGHQCDAQDKVSDLKVIALPPVGWNGSAKIKYKEKSDSEKEKIRKSNEGKGFLDAEPLGEWEIGGEMACYLDKKEWKAKPPEKFLSAIQECMNKMAPLLTEVKGEYAELSIGWPDIELSGKLDLVERPGHHDLSYDAEIHLDAKKILSFDLKVDIKAIILRILSQHEMFSDFLTEILEKAEKGAGNKYVGGSGKIEVMFESKAEVNGDLLWTRKPTEGKWGVDAAKSTIGGNVGFKVYGNVEIKGHVFCVKAAAGASITMLSADGKEMSKFTMFWAALEGVDNPTLERQMEFNGLGVYYSSYAEGSTDETVTGKVVHASVRGVSNRRSGLIGDGKKKKESNKLFEIGNKDMKKLCVLMDSWASIDDAKDLGKSDI